MKCNKCGYDYSKSGDSAHVCEPEWMTTSKAIVKEHIKYYNEMMKDEPKSKCAQCKKEYKHGKANIGCPKCAPNVDISESEFQKPIGETIKAIRTVWIVGGDTFQQILSTEKDAHKFIADLGINTPSLHPSVTEVPVLTYESI